MDRRLESSFPWLLYGSIFTINAISIAAFGAAEAAVVLAAVTGLLAVATFLLTVRVNRERPT